MIHFLQGEMLLVTILILLFVGIYFLVIRPKKRAKKQVMLEKYLKQQERKNLKKEDEDNNEGLMKKCPACAEEIKQEANKCRFCGELQDTPETQEMLLQQKKESSQEEIKKDLINGFSWILGVGVFALVMYFYLH